MTDNIGGVLNENKAYKIFNIFSLQWESGLPPIAALLTANIVFVPLAYEQILKIGPLSNLHNNSTN